MTITRLEAQDSVYQGWITPQKQLERLALSQFERDLNGVEKDLGTANESLPLNTEFFSKCSLSAIHPILKRSGISLAGSEADEFPSLFDRCVESIIPSRPLPSSLTNWYIALERIGALHDKIPPLPENIHEILEGKCPIYGGQLTVGETHSLYLIPPGTLNELVTRVSAYGREFFQGENPLTFKYFWKREELANVPNSQPQWVLISNDALPGSRKESYEKQVQMLEDLSTRGETDYQVPTLREAAAAMFLDKMVGDKMLYKAGNEQNDYRHTYTRVEERKWNRHWIVGGFAPSGLIVTSDSNDLGNVGVMALRKL